MAVNSSIGKYFVKNTANGTYQDVSVQFDGVSILSLDGMASIGKALNVYIEQWMDGTVDFEITGGGSSIVRENADLKVVYICGNRYTDTANFDAETANDTFLAYMTGTDIWLRSKYYNKDVHCVSVDKVEPKTVKLQRGSNSYIIGEFTLKCLGKPTAIPTT